MGNRQKRMLKPVCIRRISVRDALTAVATPEAVADLVAGAVSSFLARTAQSGLSKGQAAKLVRGCERGGMALIHLNAGLMKDDAGKPFGWSREEGVVLVDELRSALRHLLTEEALQEAAQAVCGASSRRRV